MVPYTNRGHFTAVHASAISPFAQYSSPPLPSFLSSHFVAFLLFFTTCALPPTAWKTLFPTFCAETRRNPVPHEAVEQGSHLRYRLEKIPYFFSLLSCLQKSKQQFRNSVQTPSCPMHHVLFMSVLRTLFDYWIPTRLSVDRKIMCFFCGGSQG